MRALLICLSLSITERTILLSRHTWHSYRKIILADRFTNRRKTDGWLVRLISAEPCHRDKFAEIHCLRYWFLSVSHVNVNKITFLSNLCTYVTGPSTWVTKFPMAAGSRQSPVNIETKRVESDHEALSSKPLRWKYPATASRKLLNPGYCWRVDTDGEGTCECCSLKYGISFYF